MGRHYFYNVFAVTAPLKKVYNPAFLMIRTLEFHNKSKFKFR